MWLGSKHNLSPTDQPLIPYIEQAFNINYTIVSTMFISQCVGYMFGECRISNSFGQEAAAHY